MGYSPQMVKKLLWFEFVALLALGIGLFAMLPFAWWWFPLLILVPDVSMIGYVINTRAGAFLYNAVHTLSFGIAVYLVSIFLGFSIGELAGVILIAHSALDRVCGYGLKFSDSFKHTHLKNL